MTYAIVTVVVLIFDQLLKFWTTKNIPLLPDSPTAEQITDSIRELIPGVIHMTNIHNDGAAFSILEGARWFFVILTVIFVIAVVVLISQEIIRGPLGRWSAVLVMAGAISNGLDRALYGYVVDMFEFEFMNFAIFNLADVFITVCGILFCVYILFEKPSPEEMAAGQGGGLIVMLQNAHKGKRATAGTSHADARRANDGETESIELRTDEDEPVRRSRSERRRAREASPLDAIPKRGEHKSLQDELSAIDPADPFAEWNDDAEAKAEPKEAAAEPVAAETTAPAAEDPLSFDGDLSFDLDSILSEFGDGE